MNPNSSKRLAALFSGQPWAIHPPGLREWAASIEAASGEPRPDNDDVDIWGDPVPKLEILGGVAIVPIVGPVINRASQLEVLFGATSPQRIDRDLSAALADPSLKAVLLNIDSPGGTLCGCPELSAKIALIAQTTPTFAFSDSLCASAAFSFASGATAIFATPSSQTGSVGVILELTTIARLLNEQGIDSRIFSSARLKAAGHPHKHLEPHEDEMFRSQIAAAASLFEEHVRVHRPGVKDEAFSGAVFFGQQAKDLGLVDEVVTGFDDCMSRVRVIAGDDDKQPAHRSTSVAAGGFDRAAALAAYDRAAKAGRAQIHGQFKITTGRREDFKKR